MVYASVCSGIEAASAIRALTQTDRFALDTSLDWPTPILPDQEIEYWARQYQIDNLAETGLRFILFLQCPQAWRRSTAPC